MAETNATWNGSQTISAAAYICSEKLHNEEEIDDERVAPEKAPRESRIRPVRIFVSFEG